LHAHYALKNNFFGSSRDGLKGNNSEIGGDLVRAAAQQSQLDMAED
jgi:hypothetical protein